MNSKKLQMMRQLRHLQQLEKKHEMYSSLEDQQNQSKRLAGLMLEESVAVLPKEG